MKTIKFLLGLIIFSILFCNCEKDSTDQSVITPPYDPKITFAGNSPTNNYYICAMNLDGTNQRILVDKEDPNFNPKWLSNEIIVFIRKLIDGHELFTVNVFTEEVKKVSNLKLTKINSPVVHFSSQKLAMLYYDHPASMMYIYVYNLTTEELIETYSEEFPTLLEIYEWSSDGEWLIIRDKENTLAKLSLNGTKIKLLPDNSNPSYADVSSENLVIYCIDDEIWTMDMGGNNNNKISDYGYTPKYNPKDSKIYFTYKVGLIQPADFFRCNIDGTNSEQITNEELIGFGFCGFCSDGTKIISAGSSDNQVNVYSIEIESATCTKLTDNGHPNITPDVLFN